MTRNARNRGFRSCPACGYDLRGLRLGRRCPECGGRGTPQQKWYHCLPRVLSGDRDDDDDQERWSPFVPHIPAAFLRALPWIALGTIVVTLVVVLTAIRMGG